MNTDRVNFSAAQTAFTTAAIARYIAEAAPDDWLLPYVEKYQILPLLIGWTQTIGVLPDGSLRRFSADGDQADYEGLRAVGEVGLCIRALVLGAEKYPELQSMAPSRPTGAVTCSMCNGSGRFPVRPGNQG